MVEELHDTDPLDLGEYRLFGRIGRGGMGVVYLGMAPDRSQVAVKMLNPFGGKTNHKDRARFRHEIEAMSAVEHPFLVKVRETAPDGDPPWFAMEYLNGCSLKDWVDQNGPLGDTALGTLALCLSDALTALHDNGMIHRDLKPDNIMLTDEGPKIIDFGITLTAEATRMTEVGMVVGTLSYIAPELWRSNPSTAASDVFSLGAVLLFAATGHGPLTAATSTEMFARARAAEYDTSGIPENWRNLITACLAVDPQQRPTAESLFEHLTETARVPVPQPHWWANNLEGPVDVSRPGPAETGQRPDPPEVPLGLDRKASRAPRFSPRRRLLTIGAGIVALLATAGAITISQWDFDPEKPDPVYQLRNTNTGLCLRGSAITERPDGIYGFVAGVDCAHPSTESFEWRRTADDQYRNADTELCLTVVAETTRVIGAKCEQGLDTQVWRPYKGNDDMAQNAETDYCLHSPKKEQHDGMFYAYVNTKECKPDGQYQHWQLERPA